MDRSVASYLKEHSLPLDQKIFLVIGHYDDVRQEMLRKGWVEHDFAARKDEDKKFTSNAFHFMYATKSKDCFRIDNLAD